MRDPARERASCTSTVKHFVLHGHHKLEAAARLGIEVTIFSVLSLDDSLATPEEITEVLDFMGAGIGVL